MEFTPLHRDTGFLTFLVGIIFIVACVGMWHFLTLGKCLHYGSQAEAQADLLTYPELDGHPKDGLACNSHLK